MPVDIEVLVRDHKKAAATSDGIEIGVAPPLLEQLRDAIFAGMEKGGSSGSFGSRVPIDPAALELYEQIDREITAVWVAAFHRVPSIDRVEALLGEWAAWADDETLVPVGGREVYAVDAVRGWVTLIEDFFDSLRPSEIHAPCVQCGADYVYRHVDGENRKIAALRFNRDRATGATLSASCSECGAKWLPHQFEILAKALGIDVEAKKAAFFEKEEMSEAGGKISVEDT